MQLADSFQTTEQYRLVGRLPLFTPHHPERHDVALQLHILCQLARINPQAFVTPIQTHDYRLADVSRFTPAQARRQRNPRRHDLPGGKRVPLENIPAGRAGRARCNIGARCHARPFVGHRAHRCQHQYCQQRRRCGNHYCSVESEA